MSERRATAALGEIEPRHLTGIVVGAVVLGWYASWMAADLVGRWLTFPAVTLVAGYLLSGREDGRDKTVFVGYALAALVAVTPLAVVVPDVVGGFTEGPVEMGLTASNAVLFVLFLLPAAAIAYVTYRLDGGQGVLERVRARL